jgi:PHD/YefM family antitoxin component YafN of YafNO toxin-antitoxin module
VNRRIEKNKTIERRRKKRYNVIGEYNTTIAAPVSFLGGIFGPGGDPMPNIKSDTDLRNNYNEISMFCHENREPVFITKNGRGDLAVMSIEHYETLNGKFELYRLLDEGRTAVKEGRKRPIADAMKHVREELADGRI